MYEDLARILAAVLPALKERTPWHFYPN